MQNNLDHYCSWYELVPIGIVKCLINPVFGGALFGTVVSIDVVVRRKTNWKLEFSLITCELVPACWFGASMLHHCSRWSTINAILFLARLPPLIASGDDQLSILTIYCLKIRWDHHGNYNEITLIVIGHTTFGMIFKKPLSLQPI